MVKRSAPEDTSACDVGTMWTMKRNGHIARCALLAMSGEWELRVLLEGEPLLTKRCQQAGRAFETAEMWKQRMADKGWSAVKPPFPLRVA